MTNEGLLDARASRALLTAIEQAGRPATAHELQDLLEGLAAHAARRAAPTSNSPVADDRPAGTEVVTAGVVPAEFAPLEFAWARPEPASAGAPTEPAPEPSAGPVANVVAEPVAGVAHAPAASVAQRAQEFDQRRQALAASSAIGPLASQPRPGAPSRSWSDILSAFMEQKNIRWGELVGGLLIVCCSIALVISFWAEIAERPFMKFFVLGSVTAALFGAGFYTERRWKLQTTSRGLLVIGSLMAPLHFLAIAAFNQQTDASETPLIAGEIASIAVFGGLLYFAGRTLTPGASMALALGVMAPAAWTLILRRIVSSESGVGLLYAVAAPPIASCVAANGWLLLHWRKRRRLAEARAHGLLSMVGLTTFAMALPLSLLVAKTGRPIATLGDLSPLSAVAALPLIAAGLFLSRRLAKGQPMALELAGPSLALFGAALAVGGLFLAWPRPALLVPAAIVDFALFSLVAWFGRLPPAHIAAIASLTTAYLAMFHVARGDLEWNQTTGVAAVMLSGTSGTALVPLTAILAGAAGWMARRGRKLDALHVGGATIGVLALSVTLVTWHGFGRAGDPLGATWVYAFDAVAMLALAAGTRRAEAAWLSAAFLFGAMAQAVVFRWGYTRPWVDTWPLALLAHAGLCVAGSAAFRLLGGAAHDASSRALGWAASVSSIAAAPLSLICIWKGNLGLAAIDFAALSAAWLGIAVAMRWTGMVWGAQAGLALSVALGVGWRASDFPWFQQARWPWLDPWTLEAIGVALTVVATGELAARLALGRWLAKRPEAPTRGLRMLVEMRTQPDRVLAGMVACLAIVVACYAAWPGVWHELSPRSAPAAIAEFEVAGVPHAHAGGVGGFALVIAALAALLAGLIDKITQTRLAAPTLLAAAFFPLIAFRWESDTAVAAALCWGLGAWPLVGSAPVWLGDRWRRLAPAAFDRVKQALGGSDQQSVNAERQSLSELLAGVLLAPACVVVTSILCRTIVVELSGSPIIGPAAGSFFGRLGLAGSYAAPVALLGLAIWGYALRERSSSLAYAGGLVMNLAASAAFLLAFPIPSPLIAWAQFFQVNAAVSSCVAIFWLAISWLAIPALARDAEPAASGPRTPDRLLLTTISQATGFLLVAMGAIWIDAAVVFGVAERLAAGAWPLGWLAVATWVAAVALAAIRFGRPVSVGLAWTGLFLISVLAACASAEWVVRDRIAQQIAPQSPEWIAGDWYSFYTLTVGQTLSAWVLWAGCWHASRRKAAPSLLAAASGWVAATSALVVVLALRIFIGSPDGPIVGLASLSAIAALFVAVACGAAERRWLFAAAALTNLCAVVAWDHYVLPWPRTSWSDLIDVNVIALAVLAPLWMTLDSIFIGPRQGWRTIAAHRFATRCSLLAMLVVVAERLLLHAPGVGSVTTLDWIALGAAFAAAVACLWDPAALDSVALVYAMGPAAIGLLLASFALEAKLSITLGAVMIAAYNILSSYVWSIRAGLAKLAGWLRIPVNDAPFAGLAWLATANCFLAIGVLALAYWTELTCPDFPLRLLVGQAGLAQVASLALLAQGRARTGLEQAALVVASVAMIAFFWSWIDPSRGWQVLDRLALASLALGSMATLLDLVVARVLAPVNRWRAAAERALPGYVAATAVALVALIAVELERTLSTGSAPMAMTRALLIVVVIAGLVAAALAAALLPGRDPLGLSERGRTAYVYAAEILAMLLLAHLRMTMPWLFHGYFIRFWPLAVMGVAFVGAGFGELFRRRQQRVLVEPLEYSAALAPALAVCGFWLLGSPIDFSIVLLAGGGVYTVLSQTRNSFGLRLLAVLSFNGALWWFLHSQDGWRLFEHPQVWLIPPALCVLVAAHMHRESIGEAGLTAVRYGTGIVVYASSTADIFINGVAQAPWLPLVLAGLSILGVLAGIWLRVRAFLFLGLAFLTLALLTIIWHAAVDLRQTWLWSACGIAAGALIIAMFAIFEKKRDEILRVVENLKQWKS